MSDFSSFAHAMNMLTAGAITGFVVEGTYKIQHSLPALNGRESAYKLVFQQHSSGSICCTEKNPGAQDMRYYAFQSDEGAFSVIESVIEKYTGSTSPSVDDTTIRQPLREELTEFGQVGDVHMEAGDIVIAGVHAS